ncbi:MAG: hypothetical protein ACLTV6_06430 [Christensenellales bacterium]
MTETATLRARRDGDTDADAAGRRGAAYRAARRLQAAQRSRAPTAAHKLILRKQGLVFDQMESDTQTFNNEKS